jgi:hypothetical protein
VGPLPKSSRGGHTYLLVGVDKLSKWIEVVPVTNQEATNVVQEFAKELITYALVAHPQTNDHVKKANGLICSGMKKRLLRPLMRAAGAWVK